MRNKVAITRNNAMEDIVILWDIKLQLWVKFTLQDKATVGRNKIAIFKYKCIYLLF